ncbi:hypothetical protein SEA_PIPPIN_97 [Mycobacterium phage Pippin]|nr:hypothetical protein SEA_PIPPIN_97 [Mycobacterium phage Pippin]
MRCESAHPGRRTPHPAYPLPRHVHTLRTHTPPCPAYPCTPHPLLPPHSTPCLCDALCPMRQRLGTEDAPSSMLTRLRDAMLRGIDGAPHRGDG